MRCKLTFNCGSVEDAVLAENFKWVVGERHEHYIANDTLDLITWCDIGNIKISFYSEEDMAEFKKHIKEDIANNVFHVRKGTQFLRSLRKKCKTF